MSILFYKIESHILNVIILMFGEERKIIMSKISKTMITIPENRIGIDILISDKKLGKKEVLGELKALSSVVKVYVCKKKGIFYILEGNVLEKINLEREVSESEIVRLLKKKYSQDNVTKKLIDSGTTISTMESCTSGLIASTITDIEGASEILEGSAITYSNKCKILEGVPKRIIEKYGVYSKETALHMAKAAKRKYYSKIAIGVTGSAGRVDPNNKDSVSGEIFYSIYSVTGKVRCSGKITFLDCSYTRKQFKEIITEKILSQLKAMI